LVCPLDPGPLYALRGFLYLNNLGDNFMPKKKEPKVPKAPAKKAKPEAKPEVAPKAKTCEIGDNTYTIRGDKVFKKHGQGEKVVVNQARIDQVKDLCGA
tara:strand:- start:151 stop:447 length:297 start_codon:yes stop_codon:yes gene_type:complete